MKIEVSMSGISKFFTSPFEEFLKYRELIFYQLKGDLKRKHFGKVLGPAWWIGEPLALGVMFVFITMFLFKDNFGEHHTITIIAGVLIWHWFSRSVAGSPNLLLGFRKELSMTNFPIYPLVYTNILNQLMMFGFSLAVIFIGLVISGVTLTYHVAYVPLLIIIQLTLIIAIVTNLAKFGIFVRDITQAVTVIIGMLFFVSPIIYQKVLVPQEYRIWYDLNPLATLLPAWRDVLINGVHPDLFSLGIWFAISLPLAFYGFRSLAKSRAEYYRRL
jgi:ABC-type polysaccharide/polyol phosphate export permease